MRQLYSVYTTQAQIKNICLVVIFIIAIYYTGIKQRKQRDVQNQTHILLYPEKSNYQSRVYKELDIFNSDNLLINFSFAIIQIKQNRKKVTLNFIHRHKLQSLIIFIFLQSCRIFFIKMIILNFYNIALIQVMENMNQFQQNLNQFLLSISTNCRFVTFDCQSYAANMQGCSNLFEGRFHRALINCKKNIVELIQPKISSIKDKQVLILQYYLKPFTTCFSKILNECLFNAYLSIVDYTKKEQMTEQFKQEQQDKKQFINLLKLIIRELNALLFYFFVYCQFNKQKKILGEIYDSYQKNYQQNQALSDHNNHLQSIQQDNQVKNQQLYNQIQRKLSVLTIYDLIQNYLKQEQNKIIDSFEVCRVCSQKIQLKKFQVHSKICAKKAKVQIQFAELQIKRKNLHQHLTQIQKSMIRNSNELDERQLHKLRIITMIKNLLRQQKKKGGIKRNTFIGGLKTQLIQQIRDQIEFFQRKYSKDQQLCQLLKRKQQINQTRKRIQAVQIQDKAQINSIQDSQISSFKSLQSSINKGRSTNAFKTKKSLFVKGSDASKKQTSHQKNKSILSDSSQKISIGSASSITSSNQSFIEEKTVSKKQKQRIPSYMQHMKRSGGDFSRFIDQKYKITSQTKSMKHFSLTQNEELQTVGLCDFQVLKILGKGAYGQVYLVRRKTTKDLYALKHIRFQQQQNQNQINLIKKQHQIFKKIAGDHLIRAPFAFSENFGHFFVLQFMPGGDLSKMLSEEVYLDEDNAKFYLAQIVLALQHLHKCGIIHRDLKPENIVIQKNGHIKLTDFGLSDIKIKDKIQKAKQKLSQGQKKATFQRSGRRVALINRRDIAKIIGTPDYIAPQIINQTSINNHSIDWWSLGVMAYQMLVGCRPFSALTVDEVLSNILQCKIQWPSVGRQQQMMSPQAYDLISKLLDKNFKRRIGSQNCDQIKNHPFFEGIDWENIKHEKPPILPNSELNNIKQYVNFKQDKQLLQQIMKTKIEQSGNKKIEGLQNFVRYDVLMQQTYQSIGQKLKNEKQKMHRMKTLKTFLQDQQKQNINVASISIHQDGIINDKQINYQNNDTIKQHNDDKIK